jgi:dTDP-4-dehydrorhamnose reductase
MKFLVIGVTGQVGSLLVDALKGRDAAATRRPEVDLRDRASVERAIATHNPDAVILAAGMANADLCEDDPSQAYAVNADGARTVAEASRDCHFTYLSTDHVFNGKNGPYAEEDATDPLNVYGRTKLEGERITLSVHPRGLVVRTTLVFNHDPGGRSFFTKLLGATSPVPCWTDHLATYTYGPDLARAVIELAETGRTGIWNVSGPDMLNRHAFALRVAARFGIDPALFRPVSIRDAPPRAPRPLRAGLRNDKARAELGTKLLSVDEALEVEYRAHGKH